MIGRPSRGSADKLWTELAADRPLASTDAGAPNGPPGSAPPPDSGGTSAGPAPASDRRSGPSAARLGVVVVNFRSHELIERNLGGIDWADAPPTTVVVVDNYSTAAERRAVERLARARSWKLVAPDANVGFGAGTNLGVKRALAQGCSHVLLLNPDVVIDAGGISRLLAFAAEHPMTLVSPRLERPDGSMWFADGRLDPRTGLTRTRSDPPTTETAETLGDTPSDQAATATAAVGPKPQRWLTAACLVVDRDAWERVAGFDQRFFLYWEDVDLSRRFLQLGGELVVLPDVTAVHGVGGTQGESGKSARYCFYMCRNRLLFAAAHLPGRERLRWLWHAPRYARHVALWHSRRDMLRHPWRAPAALAGTAAGAAAVLASLRRT